MIQKFQKLWADPEFRRLLRFLVVGVLNTVFGYAVFALLLALGLPPQPALILAFASGVAWNYHTHARLVFAAGGQGRFAPYGLVYLALYGLNAVMLEALLWAEIGAALAQAIYLPIGAGLSYVAIGRVLTERYPWSPR
ncbi:MAG: GtrA family protein [Mangrovicoccus sp.]